MTQDTHYTAQQAIDRSISHTMTITNPWLNHDIPVIEAAVERARRTRRPVGMVDGLDIDNLVAILDGHSGRPPAQPGITVREYLRRHAESWQRNTQMAYTDTTRAILDGLGDRGLPQGA